MKPNIPRIYEMINLALIAYAKHSSYDDKLVWRRALAASSSVISPDSLLFSASADSNFATSTDLSEL